VEKRRRRRRKRKLKKKKLIRRDWMEGGIIKRPNLSGKPHETVGEFLLRGGKIKVVVRPTPPEQKTRWVNPKPPRFVMD
jgi:hypothetical protein